MHLPVFVSGVPGSEHSSGVWLFEFNMSPVLKDPKDEPKADSTEQNCAPVMCVIKPPVFIISFHQFLTSFLSDLPSGNLT